MALGWALGSRVALLLLVYPEDFRNEVLIFMPFELNQSMVISILSKRLAMMPK